MPFSFKNAGVTYQRAMVVIICNHLQKIVKCYVYDIAVKSQNKEDHIKNLRTILNLIRAYQLKMNTIRFFLGVPSGKFFGFMVMSKGIPLDADKVKSMQDIKSLKNIKEL